MFTKKRIQLKCVMNTVKKYIYVILTLSLVFPVSSCKQHNFDSVKGEYKPSEKLGDMEIKSDGKVVFKKLGVEGRAVMDQDQIAVKMPSGVTYYFTKKADGNLVQGISNPSEKLMKMLRPKKHKSIKEYFMPSKP